MLFFRQQFEDRQRVIEKHERFGVLLMIVLTHVAHRFSDRNAVRAVDAFLDVQRALVGLECLIDTMLQ